MDNNTNNAPTIHSFTIVHKDPLPHSEDLVVHLLTIGDFKGPGLVVDDVPKDFTVVTTAVVTELTSSYVLVFPNDASERSKIHVSLPVLEGSDCDIQLFKSQLNHLQHDVYHPHSLGDIQDITFIAHVEFTEQMRNAIMSYFEEQYLIPL